ncbi:MAG: LysM domain-containing protein [Syntrophobacterales bacterium]|jgi:tetratricopeptide (TPR) repeat protein
MKWRFVPLLVCLNLAMGGCAAFEKALKPKEPEEVRLERILLERALEYERQGEWHKALRAYEAALGMVVAKKDSLEISLRKRSEEHYRRGLELRKQGKYVRARHEFLVALHYRPDFPEVVDLLRPARPSPYTYYIVHEVKQGEFLTAIAQKYYNDQNKFEVIARFNNLKDATKLHAGMKLKIPEIKGVRFPRPEKKQVTTVPVGRKGAMEVTEKISPTTPGDQLARAEVESSYSLGSEDLAAAQQQETDDYQVAIYEEQGIILLEEGQYLAALHEFQKVYDTDPAREQIREYMSWAHYRQGEVLFQQAEYLEARHHFEEALSFDAQCTSCKQYIDRAADAYKDAHYLKGIQLFEEEKLKEAIEEWQLVSELDSDYKQVQSYLLRAQNLLEKVQELKEVP